MGTVRTFVMAAVLAGLAAGFGTARAADEDALKHVRDRWNAAMADIKDMTMDQEMKLVTPQGEQAFRAVRKSKGAKWRTESTMGGMPVTMIFDGTDIWMVTPQGAMKAPPQKAFDPTMTTIPNDAKLVRTEKVGDRDCLVVEVKNPKTGATDLWWLDAKSAALVKAEVKDGKDVNVATFSDFKKVFKDYEAGHKIELTTNGKPAGTLTIKSIQVNTGLADDLFVVNAENQFSVPKMPR